jgi:hypothetical protein
VRRVYIAHPYGGRAENREAATRFFMRAAELGYEPVAPWLIVTAHWTEARRAEGMAINLNAVRACDEIWLCGPEITPGMLDEAVAFAQTHVFARDNARQFRTLADLDGLTRQEVTP